MAEDLNFKTRPHVGRINYVLIAICAMQLVGCGVIQSGHWDDDKDNWKRAFGGKKPKGVEILHSYYWRAPSIILYEGGYVFQLMVSDDYQKLLVEDPFLRKLRPDEQIGLLEGLGSTDRDWFPKKTLDKYDVWVPKEGNISSYKVIIDRETGYVFISDVQ